jgi:hypothetical protein
MLKVVLLNKASTEKEIQSLLKKELNLLAGQVFEEVKKNTPVDTGRARDGWKKNTSDTAFEVTNAVPYVPVLDRGRHMTNRGVRGSKQAPKGIVGPSLDNIKKRN